jgi:cytochrome c-type biogenesis protein CcmH
MTAFVIWAAVCAAAAALFVATPMLRRSTDAKPGDRLLGAGAGVLVVAAAALLYPYWSNWSWRSGAPTADSDSVAGGDNVETLLAITRDKPEDVQAWLNLGRAYLRITQWPLARRSFQHADRLSNGGNAAALAGLAQTIVFENNGGETPEAEALFERALALDPRSPQALFYTGVALLNGGRLPEARARFSALRDLGPPPQVVDALDKQIAAIDVEIARRKPDPATAIHLLVTLAAPLRDQVPSGATLFVFVRSPQGGPPLAVKRLAAGFPQRVDLSAADSVMAGNRINPGQHVEVMARLSASGTPTASSGDLYGELSAVAGAPAQHALTIDRSNP